MTSAATSFAIPLPTGLRASGGSIVLDTSYTTATGIVISAAQWGSPNGNFPDFVIFTKNLDTVPDDWGGLVQYNGPGTGTVRIFGTAPQTDDVGVTEEATETIPAITVTFLAFYIDQAVRGGAAVITA